MPSPTAAAARGFRRKSFIDSLKLTVRSCFPAAMTGNGPQTRPRRILTTDIPDPDNFLMILRVLKDNPKQQVDIVLSPRPACFSAYPYSQKVKDALLEAVYQKYRGTEGFKKFPDALRKILTPIRESDSEWVATLGEKERPWFYIDETLGNPDIVEDTKIYMTVSWLRLVSFLDAHEIDRKQYAVYWDTKFQFSRTIQPGCHHAAHKPDFTFDFSREAKAEYNEAVTNGARDEHGNGEVQSEALRQTTRRLCDEYIVAKIEQLKQISMPCHADLTDLIKDYRRLGMRPEIYCGGPFTELLQIVRSFPVKRVVAMGGFIDGSSNIFANQFNFLIDMGAARTVLEMAQDRELDLTLLPTECVKGSVYELTRDEFERHVGRFSPASRALYDAWDPEAKKISMFDLLAVMAAAKPNLYTLEHVALKDTADVIRFKPLEPIEPDDDASKGKPRGIKMFWNQRRPQGVDTDGSIRYGGAFDTDEHMLAHRPSFLRELDKTFRPR